MQTMLQRFHNTCLACESFAWTTSARRAISMPVWHAVWKQDLFTTAQKAMSSSISDNKKQLKVYPMLYYKGLGFSVQVN